MPSPTIEGYDAFNFSTHWADHCVVLIGYSATGPVAISWGALYQMTWAFFSAYFDEIYAAISPDWFDKSGVDPTGINLAQLQADLALIR